MALAVPSPPILRLKRSSQSGVKAMTAAWQVVYTDSSTMAWIFAGGEIDLSNMLAGDTIDIRVRKQHASGTGFVMHDQATYSDAQPVTHPSIHVSPIPDVFGVEIAMRQTAGVLISCLTEFYGAKRLGLV